MALTCMAPTSGILILLELMEKNLKVALNSCLQNGFVLTTHLFNNERIFLNRYLEKIN